MAKLIYGTIASLDGFIEDANGSFDWAAPDHEVHQYVNELERPNGTYLYGRKTYETMIYWENVPNLDEEPPEVQDFATLWKSADKVVFSHTLQEVSSAKTRIEQNFDVDMVRRMKDEASSDMSIAGPSLASSAFHAGLIDECYFIVNPVAIGSGKPAFPTNLRINLELLDEQRFRNGVVSLRYQVLN